MRYEGRDGYKSFAYNSRYLLQEIMSKIKFK